MPVKIKQSFVPKSKTGLTDLSIARRIIMAPNASRFVGNEKNIIEQIKKSKKQKHYLQALRFEDLLLTALLKKKASVKQVKACLEQMIEDAQKGNHSAELKLAAQRYEDLDFILKRFGYKID